MVRHNKPRRDVCDAHRRVCSINRLTAVTTSAIHIDAQVVRVDFDIRFFSFWKNSNGYCRGVNTSLTLCYWNALNTVNTQSAVPARPTTKGSVIVRSPMRT